MNGKRKFQATVLAVLLGWVVAGCAGISQGSSGNHSGGGNNSGGGDNSGNNENPPPSTPGVLTVGPTTATVRGGDTVQLTPANGGEAMPPLTWSVNDIHNGNNTVGQIAPNGLFTAPEFAPSPNVVTVTVALVTDNSKKASSKVTIQNPVPQITSVVPSSIPVGTFKITVNGAHFAANAVVYLGSTALTTTRVNGLQLTASGTATSGQQGNVSITVKNPDPGSATSSSFPAKVVASTGVSISISGPASVHAGSKQGYTATVTGTTDTAVEWFVNDTSGDSVIGYMNSQGVYQTPPVVPTPNTVTISAKSHADPTKFGTAKVTLVNPVPAISALNPASLAVGPYLLTVTGTGFVPGAVVNFGGQPLTTMFISSTELNATGTVGSSGGVSVTVSNPNPGAATSTAVMIQVLGGSATISPAAAARFLEQSSFGPTPETVNQVSQLGFDSYLSNQFASTASTYPNPATDSGISDIQNVFFSNAVNNGDQLRLRVAFALNELWVVSGNKVGDPVGYTNYVRVLHKDALGNYYDVMKDVTLTPAMGHFLDMVDNDKPGNGQHANENYARELMQLFTLGLSQLNSDGTPVLDSDGLPVPTYTQDDVMALGRSFTGWTYPTKSGQSPQKHNPEYYGGPMVPYDSNHDSSAKTFLGQSISSGQSASQEIDSVLTVIFNHPNLPPFVAKQLILKLVTSNPSPAYIQRVATAFSTGKYNSYGSGKRGDMQATVAAILLDSEARRGDSAATADPKDGKLREPIVAIVAVARAFHAKTDGSQLSYLATNMGQNLFNSPSVFNFFPPENPIPQTTLNGPEFAIYNTNTSIARMNFINSAVYGGFANNTMDFSPVINAGTPDQMLAYLDTLFMHGTMPDDMKQTILTAVGAVYSENKKEQARAAIYLVLSSSQYQVQH